MPKLHLIRCTFTQSFTHEKKVTVICIERLREGSVAKFRPFRRTNINSKQKQLNNVNFTKKMTRHGKNCTNGAVYSYHERRKDAKASGFGSEKARFSKDSIKGFDCCCLTLQPCDNPVVTKQGWLYDKEAIIKYMLEKKKEYAKKLKEYERQKDEDIKELHEIAEAEKAAAVAKFEKAENTIVRTKDAQGSSSTKGNLPSFWVPSMTPQASKSKIEKPDKTIYCPMSGKALKMKDLIDVKFHLIRPDDKDAKKSLIAR